MNLEALKEDAAHSPRKRSRIILVPGFDMVICLHRDSYVRCHRHPSYEAYHVIEGALRVSTTAVKIHDEDDPYVALPPGTWHEPRAASEFVIYREFYCGPFDKARDVEYAKWAPKEKE